MEIVVGPPNSGKTTRAVKEALLEAKRGGHVFYVGVTLPSKDQISPFAVTARASKKEGGKIFCKNYQKMTAWSRKGTSDPFDTTFDLLIVDDAQEVSREVEPALRRLIGRSRRQLILGDVLQSKIGAWFRAVSISSRTVSLEPVVAPSAEFLPARSGDEVVAWLAEKQADGYVAVIPRSLITSELSSRVRGQLSYLGIVSKLLPHDEVVGAKFPKVVILAGAECDHHFRASSGRAVEKLAVVSPLGSWPWEENTFSPQFADRKPGFQLVEKPSPLFVYPGDEPDCKPGVDEPQLHWLPCQRVPGPPLYTRVQIFSPHQPEEKEINKAKAAGSIAIGQNVRKKRVSCPLAEGISQPFLLVSVDVETDAFPSDPFCRVLEVGAVAVIIEPGENSPLGLSIFSRADERCRPDFSHCHGLSQSIPPGGSSTVPPEAGEWLRSLSWQGPRVYLSYGTCDDVGLAGFPPGPNVNAMEMFKRWRRENGLAEKKKGFTLDDCVAETMGGDWIFQPHRALEDAIATLACFSAMWDGWV